MVSKHGVRIVEPVPAILDHPSHLTHLADAKDDASIADGAAKERGTK
jgi:hypothetical protein